MKSMLRSHKRSFLLILVLWLTVTPTRAGPASIANASDEAAGYIGWVLTFDVDASATEQLAGTFHFVFKFQGSSSDYDLAGTVGIYCEPNRSTKFSYQCAIPDMAALILEASEGQINIRRMPLPLGTLEACGQITVLDPNANMEIISASSSTLYALHLEAKELVLSHAQRATRVSLAGSTDRFHLALLDTTLVAPASYTLDITVHAPDLYRLNTLTVVDPGAFAHLHDAC